MTNPKYKLRFSQESNQDRESVETELAFYARCNSEDLGENAGVELHEQLEAEFKNGTRARCRMTKGANGSKKYVQTMKIPRATEHGITSVVEHSVDIDYDFFEAFRHAAHRCIKKARVRYPTKKVQITTRVEGQNRIVEGPELFFEVDIFKDKTGKAYEWVKIDLELDALLAFIDREFPNASVEFDVDLVNIPLELTDIFSAKDPEKKDILSKLWEDVVLNPQAPEA